ncbi:MAG TPA: NADH-quinone oxidoreductase subunit B family protein [Chloroflexota bacterium]|jgi:NADH-quinone oxidoreductase subunit B|nr:NADH-quinone oxidoreductase subunit B family protein [Chloroflexota bacterium]
MGVTGREAPLAGTSPAIGNQSAVPVGAADGAGRALPVDPQPENLYARLPQGIVTSTVDQLFQWARKSSLWPMTFGLACCAIEMIGTFMAKHDLDRFGLIGQVGATPRQSDLMIVSGTVTTKMVPAIKTLYDQMPEPKWVISMGGCATCGGPYYRYPTVVQGVDQAIPVDVYIGGCPPRPEALMHGILKLQEKIMRQAKEGRRPRPDFELVLAGEGVEQGAA